MHPENTSLMTLEEFLHLYPELTPEQLAELTGKSLSTVYKWYQRDPIPVSNDVLIRLELAHYVWSLPPQPEYYAELLRLKGKFFDNE